MCELALSLRRSFEKTGDLTTLCRAIEYQRTLLNLQPSDNEDRTAALHNLGQSLSAHGMFFMSKESLDEARSLLTAAASCRQPGHPYRHTTLHFLAGLMGRMAEIDHAIPILHEVLSLRLEGHPERPATLILLAITYRERYLRDIAHQDLFTARDYAKQAYDRRPRHSSMLSKPEQILVNYGAIMHDYYTVFGDISDLDRAVEAYRGSLDYYTQQDPWRCASVVNLAHALRARFIHSHQTHDIVEAISIQQHALAEQLPGRSGYNTLVHGLASTYRTHFWDGNTELSFDPDEVIRLIRSTGADTTRAVTMGYVLRCELAEAYSIRFKMFDDLASLDESIHLSRQILGELNVRQSQQRTAKISLAHGLRHRFHHLGDPKDAEESLELLLQAATMFWSTEQRGYASILNYLAHLYMDPRAPFHNLETSLGYLIQSLKLPSRTPWRRLQIALEALEKIDDMFITLSVDALRQILEVYQLAMELLPRIASFGLGRLPQLRALRNVDSCAISAARYALALGKANVALELLEEGRAVFWQQYLRLRTEFDNLPEHLASALRETSGFLEQVFDENTDRRRQEADTIVRRQVGERFRSLLEEARRLPGFERLLLPNRFEAISTAATEGPLVVLIASKSTSHAIIISATQPDGQAILLPTVGIDELTRYHATVKHDTTTRSAELANRGIRLRPSPSRHRITTVLENLWARVFSPIIQHLGLKV